MWVFLNDAFISAVEHKDQKDCLMIRARRSGDLTRALGTGTIETKTEDGDYMYRTVVRKSIFAAVLASHAANIDYENFKGSIEDRSYHDACLGVWSVMRRFQDWLHRT